MLRDFDHLANISTWLRQVMDHGQFNVLVPVERKATALLRAILDMHRQPGLDLRWDQVISSDAISYCDVDSDEPFWVGKRVLVFNELVHTGTSTSTVVREVRRWLKGFPTICGTGALAGKAMRDCCNHWWPSCMPVAVSCSTLNI